MTTPLLLTKFHPPAPRAGLVRRPRLLERLKTSGKLILICAPAGFGKTTLAGCMLARQNLRAGWLSLDTTDNDPQRFFTYLITALNRIDPAIGQVSLEMLQSPDAPTVTALFSHFINDLAQSAQEYILALDDYHLIQNQTIHNALTFLLENQPPQLHLVIISRTEPPLPLAKLRAKNQLVELNANDLRFTWAEAETFLNQSVKLGLSGEQITQLETKTEGWITGLQLAALSLKNAADASKLVETLAGDNRYVADYLVGEVLLAQPQAIQQFLLHTSILNRLCADLCDTVMETDNSQTTLETLETANLFVVPLDDVRRWYRYHHLFADMLRRRLEAQQPDVLPQLYRRAFVWHRNAGLHIEAVHYALQGKLYTEAADVVEQIGHQTYWRNLAGMVSKWLRQLPAAIVETRPQLRILQVLVLIDLGQIRAAEEALEHLARYLAEHPFTDAAKNLEFEGKVRAMQSAVAYHRYLDGAMTAKYADRALEILSDACPFDRCVAAFHGGGGYFLLGELDEARKRLAEALRLSQITGTPLDKMLVQSNLGKVELAAGNLDRARHFFAQTCEMAKKITVQQASTFSDALTGTGLVHYLQNDLDKAQSYFKQSIEVSGTDEFLDRLLVAHIAMIQVYHAQGHVDRAAAVLQQVKAMMARFDAPTNITHRLAAEQARLWLVQGNSAQAKTWATKQANLPATCQNQAVLMITAQIFIAQANYSRAATILLALRAEAERQGRFNSVIPIEILLAQTRYRQNNTLQAMAHLQHALELAEPHSIIRPFLDNSSDLGEVLSGLLHAETLTPTIANFAGMVLGHIRPTPQKDAPSQPAAEAALLTPRELGVLRHLSAGHTYAQIATDLVITENTLKYHIKNIYSKLGVKNRVQAIAAARELKLL